jgi:hypothetical protein
MALSDRDRAILEFEQGWWTEPGTKEAALRARLDLSPSRYRELLYALIDDPEAMALDPLVVRRVRRARERNRKARFEGKGGRSAGEPPRR